MEQKYPENLLKNKSLIQTTSVQVNNIKQQMKW